MTGTLATAESRRPFRAAAKASDRPRRFRWRDPRTVVAIAAVLSGALAVTLSLTIFSGLSINNDESVYLLQAKALAAGHLFPQAGHPAASFTPWLGVIRGGHYVLKYTPVVPGFLAASLVLTGGYAAALAFWAMALVGTTYLLANEVTRSRGTAATAAVLMAASPLVIIQSALALAYVPFLVLAQLTFWGLITGLRRDRFRRLVVAGFCAGLGVAIRPWDALLLLTPAAVWVLWTGRGRRLRLIGGALAGLAAPAAGLLWFDAVATGSPLKVPFSLFQPGDSLGWGVHRLFPGERPHNFGLAQGWEGLQSHLSLVGGGWVFGGVVLVALALFGVLRLRQRAAGVAILAGGLLLVVGYLYFWGTWNAAILWGGIRYIGPFYLMPILIPLTILGANGLSALRAQATWRAAITLVAAIAISGITLGYSIAGNAGFHADNSTLDKTVAAQGRSLMFVSEYPSYLQHPTAVISNATPPGGRTVYALQRGSDDFTVLRSYPGRPLYRLRLLGEYGQRPNKNFGARIEQLRVVSAPTLAFDLGVKVPDAVQSARVVVSVGKQQRSLPLAPNSVSQLHLTISAGPTKATAQGSQLALDNVSPGSDGQATVTLFVARNHGRDTVLDRQRFAVEQTGAGQSLRAIAPSRLVKVLGPDPAPAMTLQLAS